MAPLLIAIAVAAVTAIPMTANGECVLVRERAPRSVPHIAVHFGVPSSVPRVIECSAPLDKGLPTLCVPIYAYNLWEGADEFVFAVHSPQAPTGFDRGSNVVEVSMSFETGSEGTTTSLRLATTGAMCGPVLLGCLRLPTVDLPDLFSITMAPHRELGAAAVRAPSGEWRALVVDNDGARVGVGATCPPRSCGINDPVRDLVASSGAEPGFVDFSWTSGSGNFTMLRYRTDGGFSLDPWDGELLAFLPSTITAYTHVFDRSLLARVTAWSVTRGPFGTLYAASNVECGSMTTAQAHFPVGVSSSTWGNVKTLYR